MNPTTSRNVSYIFALLFVLLIVPAAANAQSYTPEESSCYNMVQGKVAWNTAGNTTWSEANVRNLCKGTSNASATVSCFRSKISEGLVWDKATAACTPAALASAPKRNTAALLQEQPKEVENTVIGEDNQIIFKNNGTNAAQIRVFRFDQPSDETPLVEERPVSYGQTSTAKVYSNIPTNLLEVEIRMVVFSGNFNSFTSYVPIYRAKIRQTKGNQFCFEATGTAYEPSVKPCDQTLVVEAKRISFKNEAGFVSKLTLDYQARNANGGYSTKTVSTDDTVLGMKRALYIPRDAALDQRMTMKVNVASWNSPLLQKELLASSLNDSTCYKVWGNIVRPKTSVCAISSGARTIKLNNNSGFNTMMEVTYNDGGETSVRTNMIELLQNDTIEIPYSAPNVPIEVKFYSDPPLKVFSTKTISSTFSGEMCYRTEGTIFSPVVSNCDNSIGDSSNVDVRQIRFQNDAGYDAEMIVTYFVNEKVDGVPDPIPMLKTAKSGFINGLGGKFRLINIPKVTSPNMPITITLAGSATVKNGIFATTLPGDFAATPQPCFKVWGTLFNPGGGTCNQ